MLEVFGPDGLIARAHPEYEYRPGQMEMARAVMRAFEEDEMSSGMSGDFGVETPFQIPNDSYFLMGDNRDNSEDSRYRGPVPRNLIWGKPSIVYYSESNSDRAFTKVQ